MKKDLSEIPAINIDAIHRHDQPRPRQTELQSIKKAVDLLRAILRDGDGNYLSKNSVAVALTYIDELEHQNKELRTVNEIQDRKIRELTA